MKNPHNPKYHIGVTTIGEKGQIVIPADIRDALKLVKGERLMVVTKGDQLFLIRPKHLEHFTAQLSEGLSALQKMSPAESKKSKKKK